MNKLIVWLGFSAIFILMLSVPTLAERGPADLSISCDPVLQKGLERCLTILKLKQAAQRKYAAKISA